MYRGGGYRCGHGRSFAPQHPQEMNSDKNMVSVNTFAFDLYRLLSKDSQKNEFFSPFSVLTALNMTLLGSKNNTEKELFDGLRYSLGFANSDEVHAFFKKTIDIWNKTANEFTLDVANRVLVHKSDGFAVNADFSKQLQSVYDAQVDEVNFVTEHAAAVKTCNEWVNDKTNGKIRDILDKLEPDTRAVLLNAIYFKGSWKTCFDEKNTEMLPFYNFGEETKAKDVPLMFMSKVKAALYSTNIDGEEIRMLELPYKGDISMNILLPKSLDGLKKIEARLSFDVIQKMEVTCREVSKLWLPRFKMETNYGLVEPLIKMGVKDAFSGKADFGGIREQKDICISDIIHKAAIEVNEEGTVAAAATAVVMTMKCALMSFNPPVDFRVDHPFAYFIKDTKTGVILFAGSIYEL